MQSTVLSSDTSNRERAQKLTLRQRLINRLNAEPPEALDIPSGRPSWSWLPFLSITTALGLLLVAAGYTASRDEKSWAELVYWIGVVVLFAPISLRLLSRAPSRLERIGLVIVLGLGLYLVKVLHSPLYFTFFDEFLHFRTLHDILNSSHLYSPNPILAVSPLYPGLEIVTTAIVKLTGLDLYTSGVLVVATARVIIITTMFMFYETISGDSYVAGIGALFYTTNAFFLLFDAQFGYESLALPFATVVMFTVAHRLNSKTVQQVGWPLATVLCTFVVITTHHITSYYLVSILALWTVVTFVRNLTMRRQHPELHPGWSFLLAAALSTIWLLYIASVTVSYLGPTLFSSVNDVFKLILGETVARQLFGGGPVKQTTPLWERLVTYISAGLIMLGLFWGLWQVWRRNRTKTIYLMMSIGALAYPASQVLRFTQRGPEISARIAPYLFVPLSFILALGVQELLAWLKANSIWRLVLVAAVTVTFMGGVVVSFPQWGRYPGPYLVTADTRSVEIEGITAALRVRDVIGRHNRIAADRINGILMLSFGEQDQVTSYTDPLDVPGLFLAPVLSPTEIKILCQGRIQYLVTDQRFTRELPMIGYYYEDGEDNGTPHLEPLDPIVFDKFDRSSFASRFIDSGDIVIYDVRSLVCPPASP